MTNSIAERTSSMQYNRISWYALATLLVGGILVAINVHQIWSTSIDLAHHYALVYRLSESWSLAPNDPTLGAQALAIVIRLDTRKRA